MAAPFAVDVQGVPLEKFVTDTLQPHLEKWATHFEGVVKRTGPSPFFAGLKLT